MVNFGSGGAGAFPSRPSLFIAQPKSRGRLNQPDDLLQHDSLWGVWQHGDPPQLLKRLASIEEAELFKAEWEAGLGAHPT